MIRFDLLDKAKTKMEVIGKEVQVLNVNTGEIHKGIIESFNIKLEKPIQIDALGYDSTLTHIKAPEIYYRILVDGPKDQKK